MENTTPVSPLPSKKVIRISKKKIIIWVIILLVIGFLAYGTLYIRQKTFGTNNSASIQIPCIESAGIKCPGSNSKKSNKEYNSSYYPNTNSGDITDTREFNKVSYKGDIKTRKVEDVMDGVQDAIEIADGRIDNLNVSTNYGHAIFVIPKSNLADFKEDIEKLTHKKLYTETTTSQNLLGQKQNIEEQTDNTTTSLANLKTQQQTLTTSHNKKLADLNLDLKEVQGDLTSTRANYTLTPNNDLSGQITMLMQSEAMIKQKISNENSSYTSSNQSLQNQINSYNSTLTGLVKQDEKFENNIETVNGYITVGFISYWDMLKIFSPIHPTFLIIILVIIIWLCIRKKSYVPKVVFV